MQQQEVRQRVQQEDGAEEEQKEEEKDQTDKIREPLTEVRENEHMCFVDVIFYCPRED